MNKAPAKWHSRVKMGCVALSLMTVPAYANDDHQSIVFDNQSVSLSTFLWRARPVVVFADAPGDPRFQEQKALLLRDLTELRARDVVVIFDTEPTKLSALRTKLRPRGFQLVLLGKDGTVKLRKPLPWNVRELSRVIDKMPMRQIEMQNQKSTKP